MKIGSVTLCFAFVLAANFSSIQADEAAAAPVDEKVDDSAVEASSGGKTSDGDLAKQTQNPIANLISVPFQNNFNFGAGPESEMQWIMNVQPVIPVELNDDWLLINRVIMPVIDNPSGLGGDAGLGDIQYQAFFSPIPKSTIDLETAVVSDTQFTWGFGPILGFPTSTDSSLGPRRWTAGPALVGLVTKGPWVVGGTANHQWDWGGAGDGGVNLTFIQPFINYNLANAWYLTSAPAITANWEAGSDDVWTVPLGGGIGKIVNIGGQPINVQAQAFYNVAKPEFGPDWQARFQVQFLFPQ